MRRGTATLRLLGCAALLACGACDGSADARPHPRSVTIDARPPGSDTVSTEHREMLALLRDKLFGDIPLKEWAASVADVKTEPAVSIVRANEAVESGNPAGALLPLAEITRRKGLESRIYLQAWSAMRTHVGASPGAPEGNRVLGVVVEVRLAKGLDVLAAYEDRRARYYNQTGSGVLWEDEDPAVSRSIDAVIAAGRPMAERVAPMAGPHLPPPEGENQARVSILTPRGIRVAEGSMGDLLRDPNAGPVIRAAMDVLARLTEEVRQAR